MRSLLCVSMTSLILSLNAQAGSDRQAEEFKQLRKQAIQTLSLDPQSPPLEHSKQIILEALKLKKQENDRQHQLLYLSRQLQEGEKQKRDLQAQLEDLQVQLQEIEQQNQYLQTGPTKLGQQLQKEQKEKVQLKKDLKQTQGVLESVKDVLHMEMGFSLTPPENYASTLKSYHKNHQRQLNELHKKLNQIREDKLDLEQSNAVLKAEKAALETSINQKDEELSTLRQDILDFDNFLKHQQEDLSFTLKNNKKIKAKAQIHEEFSKKIINLITQAQVRPGFFERLSPFKPSTGEALEDDKSLPVISHADLKSSLDSHVKDLEKLLGLSK